MQWADYKMCSWIMWTIVSPTVVYTLREHREAYRICFKMRNILFGKIELTCLCHVSITK